MSNSIRCNGHVWYLPIRLLLIPRPSKSMMWDRILFFLLIGKVGNKTFKDSWKGDLRLLKSWLRSLRSQIWDSSWVGMINNRTFSGGSKWIYWPRRMLYFVSCYSIDSHKKSGKILLYHFHKNVIFIELNIQRNRNKKTEYLFV